MTFSGKNWQLMNKAEHFQHQLESEVGMMLPSLYFPNYFLFYVSNFQVAKCKKIAQIRCDIADVIMFVKSVRI